MVFAEKGVIVLLFISVNNNNAWKFFHNGRMTGGNLGLPGGSLLADNDVRENWFTQVLDHFSPSDKQVWKQRYFVNTRYFLNDSNSPVFLMIGGEGEASKLWMSRGTWIDYAKKFNALCFQLEHRYYGKSHPTEDLSIKNLQYLSSEQALADLSIFITAMNEQYGLSTLKWIAFGGSYPGSLAAWLRLKYPHLIHGAVSSSGPLLAEMDFKDYYRVVEEALNSYSQDCTKAVKQGTEQIGLLIRHMIGQKYLNLKFKLCDPIEQSIQNKKDISNFYENLASNWAGIVQYNKDNRIGHKSKVSNITIDTLCDIMINQELGTPSDRLAAINSLLLNATDQDCFDYKYDNMIEDVKNTSWDSKQSEGGRQWTYQTCTEFGFYQTSSYTPQIFSDQFPAQFFVQQCMDIFGPKYDASFLNAAAERTNTFYGALNIQVNNVVFVHGSIDPWHALGIVNSSNPDSAIYIKGTAHCANMYPKSVSDPPQLNIAREKIAQLIKKWLQM